MPRSSTPTAAPAAAAPPVIPAKPLTAVDVLAAEAEAAEVTSAVALAAAAAEPAADVNKPSPEVIASAEAMRAARAMLAEAEAEYRRIEAISGRATTEDQLRRDREEDKRIAALQVDLPWYFEQAKHDMLMFRAEVVYLSAGSTMDRVMRRWIVAASTREIVRRILVEVNAHGAKRSDQSYRFWDMRVASWWELIRSCLSKSRGGILPGEDHDMDALAAANVLISEQSATAPLGPLKREPDDQSVPGPAQLGIVESNPFSGMKQQPVLYNPIDFHVALDEALVSAAQAQAKVVMPRSEGLPQMNFPSADELPRMIAGSKVKLATMRPPATATPSTTDTTKEK